MKIIILMISIVLFVNAGCNINQDRNGWNDVEGRSGAKTRHKIELVEFLRFHPDKSFLKKILHDEAYEALKLTKGTFWLSGWRYLVKIRIT